MELTEEELYFSESDKRVRTLHWFLLIQEHRDNESYVPKKKIDKYLKVVDINAQNDLGFTGLTFACMGKNTNLVKTLLELGADPNIPDNLGRTALFGALCSRSVSNVKLILESGGDPKATDNDGNNYKAYTYSVLLRCCVESFIEN